MPSNKKTVVVVQGKLNWAKVFGEPRPNFGGDAREWTFEVEPDKAGIKTLKDNGLTDRIKGKGYNTGTKGQHAERAPFIQLKRSELNKEGKPNDHIRVVDEDGQAWDEKVLLGNETLADVKLDIRDYGVGKFAGVYPVAIRVRELVEYQGGDFAPVADADRKTPKREDTFKKDFGIVDDDIDDVV